MQVIPYPHVKETLYTEQLPNGLSVFILPKEGFQKTYATFSTKYGSIDNHFQVEGGERRKVPDGIAHFLEHKMFEEPTGDIFSVFAAQGASANAFTSFDRTVYLFSATGHIKENLTTLLNFVQNPYFTDENVEKEKGIIGQEINMYKDNPDWRVYFGLIETMYHVHPVHIDIAGTVESIGKITKEMLYDCYHTFYHPSNMSLFVVGRVEPEEIMELVRQNQAAKSFKAQGEIHRYFDEEPAAVKAPRKVAVLPVSLPKCLFGCKEPDQPLRGREMLKRELAMKVLLDILVSPSSAIYQKLYDEQLISDSFGSEYNIAENYAFTVMGGDTKDPEKLISRVQEEIDRVKSEGIAVSDFDRSKKKKIGAFLRQLNSPEAIANEFTKYRFKGIELFDILPVYEELQHADVNELLHSHFDWNRLAASIVTSDSNGA
ncbi:MULTISPECIES: EF-P 5-aminopentanol modification-associated protein YfmH [Paenibacillus]|uniref:Zinc protease n=1 Tax=Paenibacillus naphthalenovorans TaxID=162209 RepID=A0A0U2VZJ3_9BACL|nr:MULTISPECIES: pitrilysin family protein [Paenibacillus]ALS21700.1 zinc protease [Paenibacillus naphthalenovorans]GCL71429.1 insulinase family protein [Paenibacillus naphthalenovorans]SDI89045.1 Predicted Zn-dependent peptidase [Paenibacillus naphthalenovorans]